MDSQATISERADNVQLSIHKLNDTAKARNCDDYEVESINAMTVAANCCGCRRSEGSSRLRVHSRRPVGVN